MSLPPDAFANPLGLLIHPGLLWTGLGLASVPLIIHLLNRRRVRRRDWAAMTWLLAAMKRHQRRLRLRIQAIIPAGQILPRANAGVQ